MTEDNNQAVGPMFSDDEQATGLGGVTVQDAWIGLQLLDKAAANNVIQPTEFAVMTQWRTNLMDAIQRSIGKNYEEEVMKLRQAQANAQQAAQQSALEAARAETPTAAPNSTETSTKKAKK